MRPEPATKMILVMRVAILQYNPAFGRKERNLARAEKMLSGARFDLAVLPELFATGYLLTSKKETAELSEEIPGGPTTRMILDLCAVKKVYAAFGILERDGGKYYNSALLAGPKGIISHYRKIHLFAEEKKWFTPGNFPLSVSEVKGARVGMMICFDWRFPETMRTLSLAGADIILHPSNLVMPHCPEAMITRALENGVFTVTADRTGTEKRNGKKLTYIGQSEIVSPGGKILFRMGRTEEGVAAAEIDFKAARKKKLNPFNDIFSDRRPEYYKL